MSIVRLDLLLHILHPHQVCASFRKVSHVFVEHLSFEAQVVPRCDEVFTSDLDLQNSLSMIVSNSMHTHAGAYVQLHTRRLCTRQLLYPTLAPLFQMAANRRPQIFKFTIEANKLSINNKRNAIFEYFCCYDFFCHRNCFLPNILNSWERLTAMRSYFSREKATRKKIIFQ